MYYSRIGYFYSYALKLFVAGRTDLYQIIPFWYASSAWQVILLVRLFWCDSVKPKNPVGTPTELAMLEIKLAVLGRCFDIARNQDSIFRNVSWISFFGRSRPSPRTNHSLTPKPPKQLYTSSCMSL